MTTLRPFERLHAQPARLLEQRRGDLVRLEHAARARLAARLIARRRAEEAHAARFEQRAIRLHGRDSPTSLDSWPARARSAPSSRGTTSTAGRRPSRRPACPGSAPWPARRRRRRPSARARCGPSRLRRPDPTGRRERAGPDTAWNVSGPTNSRAPRDMTTCTSQPRSTRRRTSSGALVRCDSARHAEQHSRCRGAFSACHGESPGPSLLSVLRAVPLANRAFLMSSGTNRCCRDARAARDDERPSRSRGDAA